MKKTFLILLGLTGTLIGLEPIEWYDVGPEGCGIPVFCNSECEIPCCYEETPCKPVCCTSATSHLDLGYASGRSVDTDKNYPFARLLWFPDCKVGGKNLFYQVSGLRFSDKTWAGSVGAGVRWQPRRTCHVVGGNVFYDAREGTQATYHQIGAGIEYLSLTWEAHVNGYLPVGAKSHLKVANLFDDYAGGFFVQVNNIEQVERGIDLEVGRNYYYNDILRFYVGAGPAWYERVYSEKEYWSFMARGFIEWKRYVRLEVSTYKESGDKWHVQGVAILSFPFDCIFNPYSCGLSAPLSQPVERNMAIKKQNGCCWITNY